jgi:hypothetical protein
MCMLYNIKVLIKYSRAISRVRCIKETDVIRYRRFEAWDYPRNVSFFIHLTRLTAWEYFIKFYRRESFRSYEKSFNDDSEVTEETTENLGQFEKEAVFPAHHVQWLHHGAHDEVFWNLAMTLSAPKGQADGVVAFTFDTHSNGHYRSKMCAQQSNELFDNYCSFRSLYELQKSNYSIPLTKGSYNEHLNL